MINNKKSETNWIESKRRSYYFLYEAAKRANKKCDYCGNEYEHIHHVIPLSAGGEQSLSNLVALCQSCHIKAHKGTFDGIQRLNEEMVIYFKELNEKRSKKDIKEIISDIEYLLNDAFVWQNNYRSKKAQTFYAGKYQAYKDVLEMLVNLKE